MYCYIFCIFLALLYAFNIVSANSLESREKGPLTIDLNALKNAAEVMRVLKAMNEEAESETPQQEKGYGKQEEGLQGIDIDYLGVNEGRHQDIREILELLQKNKDAQEKHDLMKSDLTSRVYYISNPEVLEKYRKKKKEKERNSSASGDPSDSREKIKDIWKLLKTMRREGDVDDKGPSMNMIHPRLLHLNLEKHVPGIGTNIGEDEKETEKEPNLKYLRVIKDEKNDKNAKTTRSLGNTETTKMPLSSVEADRIFNEKSALRTTGYTSFERHDDTNYKGNEKKISSENTSEDHDKRVTVIDFKAKDGSKEKDTEEKSLENYRPPKKGKKDSAFDDANDAFIKKIKETRKTSPKKKETTIDDNYSVDNFKKKRNRREKQEDKWEKREDKYNEKIKQEDKYEEKPKREDRYEEKMKFKTTRREPRKEERYYEMNRPRIKPQSNRPTRNKMSKLRNDNMGSNNFKGFGRTPIPIVGKRGIYEDD